MSSGKRLEVSPETYKNNIHIIQFIGRQHALLTDIVEQLNICYTFKVRFMVLIKLYAFINVFPIDFGLYGSIIYTCYSNNFRILSIHHSNGRISSTKIMR